jgi:caffeoyl-CoA O-methyltransferase
MEFLPEKIDNYAGEHTAKESEVLAELNRETYAKVLIPRMLSGHVQGRMLATFSQMLRPKRILEIGTYTGYSAICMAEGLADDGHLHTIDVNEELEDMVKRYVSSAGFTNRISMHVGNALDIIPNLDEQWDMVFIDADKENYSNYYDLLISKLRSGAFIIADNVLWSGKVTEPIQDKDEETKALADFNNKVHEDPRVENVLFPVRDGLMVCRVK